MHLTIIKHNCVFQSKFKQNISPGPPPTPQKETKTQTKQKQNGYKGMLTSLTKENKLKQLLCISF